MVIRVIGVQDLRKANNVLVEEISGRAKVRVGKASRAGCGRGLQGKLSAEHGRCTRVQFSRDHSA